MQGVCCMTAPTLYSYRFALLGKGTPLRVPRSIPSGYLALSRLSLPSTNKTSGRLITAKRSYHAPLNPMTNRPQIGWTSAPCR